MIYQRRLFKKEKRKSILGKQAIFFHQGDYHAKLRKLVLRAFMPEVIKNMIPNTESIAKDSLQSFEGRFPGNENNKLLIPKPFFFFLLQIETELDLLFYLIVFVRNNIQCCPAFYIRKGWSSIQRRSEEVQLAYYILEKGYNSMPINLLGTLFNKSIKYLLVNACVLEFAFGREAKKWTMNILEFNLGLIWFGWGKF